MKDKEKQIEEMAKDVFKAYERCKPCNCNVYFSLIVSIENRPFQNIGEKLWTI